MPQRIELPDGQIAEFPDAMPSSEIEAVLQRQYGAPVQQESALPAWAQNIRTGVVKGAAGLMALPNLAHNIGAYPSRKATEAMGGEASNYQPYLTYPQAEALLNEGLGITPYEPKNSLEGYIQTGAEFMTGNPTRKLGTAAINIGSAVGSEAAGQATKGSENEALARTLGAVLGGGVAALTPASGAQHLIKRTPGQMLSEAMEGVTPEDIQAGKAMQRQAKKVGVPLTGAESIDSMKAPGLAQLASTTAASPSGGPAMNRFLNARVDAVKTRVGANLNRISSEQVPVKTVQDAQAAATQILESAKKARTFAVSDYYAGLKEANAPAEQMQAVLGQIDTAMQKAPRGSGLELELQKLKTNLTLEDGAPVTNLETVHQALKEAKERLDAPMFDAKAATKTAGAKLTPILESIDQTLENNVPAYKQGNHLYRRITEEVINPLRAGDIGVIAGKGYDPATMAPVSRVTQPFFDLKTARPATILETASKLKKLNPDAFPNLVRLELENRFDQAAKDLQSGSNRALGANFRNAVAGTPMQRRNLKAMMQGVAQSRGLETDTVWNAWNNTLEVLDRTGRIPGIGSQTATRQQMAQKARSSKTAALGEMVSTQPLTAGTRAIRDFMERKNYNVLAQAFTDPNSVELIEELARTGPSDARARFLVGQLLAANRLQEDGEQQKQEAR